MRWIFAIDLRVEQRLDLFAALRPSRRRRHFRPVAQRHQRRQIGVRIGLGLVVIGEVGTAGDHGILRDAQRGDALRLHLAHQLDGRGVEHRLRLGRSRPGSGIARDHRRHDVLARAMAPRRLTSRPAAHRTTDAISSCFSPDSDISDILYDSGRGYLAVRGDWQGDVSAMFADAKRPIRAKLESRTSLAMVPLSRHSPRPGNDRHKAATRPKEKMLRSFRPYFSSPHWRWCVSRSPPPPSRRSGQEAGRPCRWNARASGRHLLPHRRKPASRRRHRPSRNPNPNKALPSLHRTSPIAWSRISRPGLDLAPAPVQ